MLLEKSKKGTIIAESGQTHKWEIDLNDPQTLLLLKTDGASASVMSRVSGNAKGRLVKWRESWDR